MNWVKVSIPAKVMLVGEYAVLRGGHALAVTLNQWMEITASADRNLNTWSVTSDLWDVPREVKINSTPYTDPLCCAVQSQAKLLDLPGGKLEIKSQLRVEDGVGSSSAIRLGVCAALELLKNDRSTKRANGVPLDVVQRAWNLQADAQGLASGYDLVTQYVGGLVEFSYEHSNKGWHPHWFRSELDSASELIHIFVDGMGAPTATTTVSTANWLDGGNRFERLLECSEMLIDAFMLAIKWPSSGNVHKLCKLIGDHRKLFVGSPHFPTEIADGLGQLEGCDQHWSWKTTGAGGKDALLFVGAEKNIAPARKYLESCGWAKLQSGFTKQGLQIVGQERGEEILVKPLTLPQIKVVR